VAGEKFLRGLMEGKILAARCSSCGTKYLPPKMYCTKCYIEITSFRDVGTLGSLAALAQMHVDYDGKKVRRPYLLGFVSFRGVTGGMIARVSSTRAKVGSGVKARFKPKASRRGAVTDIVEFAPAR
jgi:uncharacterized OB-fold protein